MKRIFFVFILLALALGACSPAATPSGIPFPIPSAAPASATPAPTSPLADIPSATPAPIQKAPPTATISPSDTPAPTVTPAASATVTSPDLYTQTEPDCAAFPGFPTCGAALPLSGRLAIFDAASQTITVLDFDAKLAWKANTPPQTQRMEWLGDGNFLVTYTNQDTPALVWTNPAKPGSFNPQALVSSQRMPVFTAANGNTAWIEMKDTQFFFHVRLGPASQEQVWPAGAPSDTIHEILGWVPGAPLLLAGHHYSGNSMWVDGDRLYTLNPVNGTIKEMQANLRLGGAFDWHPTQIGLMVFGDSNQSSMMGAPRLAALDVITGQVTHLIADETVVSSYPSWTPNGKAILHAAGKAGGSVPAGDPFALSAIYLTAWPDGASRRLTNPPAGARDDWPRLLPDGNHFLYLRVPDNSQAAELRLGTLDGSQDDLVGSGINAPPQGPFPQNWKSIIAYAP